MNWIDKANKKLEEQRANFQESLDNGDAAKRVHTWRSGNGAKSQLAQGKHNFQESSGNRAEKVPNTPEHQFAFSSAGGKAQKGIPKPHAKKLAKQLDVEWTCEHCNKSGRGIGNFKRYLHHTGECSTTRVFKGVTLTKFKEIIKLLPDTFSKKQAFEICKPKGYGEGIIHNLIDNSNMIECIHKGTYKSSKDPAIYKVK